MTAATATRASSSAGTCWNGTAATAAAKQTDMDGTKKVRRFPVAALCDYFGACDSLIFRHDLEYIIWSCIAIESVKRLRVIGQRFSLGVCIRCWDRGDLLVRVGVSIGFSCGDSLADILVSGLVRVVRVDLTADIRRGNGRNLLIRVGIGISFSSFGHRLRLFLGGIVSANGFLCHLRPRLSLGSGCSCCVFAFSRTCSRCSCFLCRTMCRAGCGCRGFCAFCRLFCCFLGIRGCYQGTLQIAGHGFNFGLQLFCLCGRRICRLASLFDEVCRLDFQICFDAALTLSVSPAINGELALTGLCKGLTGDEAQVDPCAQGDVFQQVCGQGTFYGITAVRIPKGDLFGVAIPAFIKGDAQGGYVCLMLYARNFVIFRQIVTVDVDVDNSVHKITSL